MVECESFTCKDEAILQKNGRRVCQKHYKLPLDECEDSECGKEASRIWQGMMLCNLHFKEYRETLDASRRNSGSLG